MEPLGSGGWIHVRRGRFNTYFGGGDGKVTLVGMAREKEESATDVSFQLDDSTVQIEVKRWSLLNFTYVQVHGLLRSFQAKQNVAFSVRSVVEKPIAL
ncbi:unnamed protein product [Sphagnum compactum]